MTMDLVRAKQINEACFQHVMWGMGLTDKEPPSLEAYSLQEMLDASRLVKADNVGRQEVTVVCDERLIAALYVLYHYPASSIESVEPIARRPGAMVAVFRPEAESVGETED